MKHSYLLCLWSACAPLVAEHPLPLNPPALVQGDAANDAALDAVYGDSVDKNAEEKLSAALAAHPHSGALHEARAYLAWLQADTKTFVAEMIAAARDTSDPFTALYLDEIDSAPLTEGERAAFASLLDALHDKHPDAGVRALAAQHLAAIENVQGDTDSAEALTQSLGFIADWQMIGAFDNDEGKGFATVYPPENEIKLDAIYAGVVVPVHWRKVPMLMRTGRVPVSEFVSPAASVSYLVTWLRADASGEAILHASTNEPVRIWLNDALVAEEQHLRSGSIDNVTARVQLEKGWNKVLVKIAARRGGSVGVRFSATDGTPLALATSLQAQATPKGAKLAQPEPPSVASTVAPTPRAAWLRMRSEMHRGLRQTAVVSAKALHELAPKNALFETGGANILWDGDERELALERLSGLPFARAAISRAAFHTTKHLWDDARADIAEAKKHNKDSRLADERADALFEARGQTLERCRADEDIARRWPDWAWAVGELGSCLSARGYRDRAEKIATALQALEPGSAGDVERLRGTARARDDASEDIYLRRLRELQPWSSEHLLASADFERREGHADKARKFLQQAIALNPDAAAPYERLGDLSFEEERSDAQNFYAQALERNPKNSALSERLSANNADNDALNKWAPSEKAIDAVIAKKKSVEILPGASVVFLVDDEAEEVAKDGSTHSIITTCEEALDEEGRDQLIEHQLARGSRQRLRFAYAVTPEGERQEAASTTEANVRFRKLAVGSVVVVQEEVWSQPQGFLPNHATGTFFFQSTREQEEAPTWRILTTQKLNLLVRGDVKHETQALGDKTLHTFTAHHVPALQREPLMPPAQNLLSLVEFSTVSDWDEFVRWEQSLLTEAYRPAPEVNALAATLTAGKKTPAAKLAALYAYVAKKVRYQQDYETNIAGVKPHACPVVVERGYGDCKDKALLLIALGAAQGLDLRFALLRTRSAGDAQKDVPNQQFNHAITYVPKQDGIEAQFMDPTADDLDFGNLPAEDQGALSLVFDPLKPGWEFLTIPFRPKEEEAATTEITVDVKSDSEATAEENMTFHGESGVVFRKTLREKKLADKIYQSVAEHEFSGGRIVKDSADNVDDPAHPLQLHFSLDVSGTLQRDEDQTRLQLPNLLAGAKSAVSLAERQTPMRLGVPQIARSTMHVKFAPGLKIVRAPRPFRLEHRCLLATRTVDKKPNALVVNVSVERRCYEAAPSEYGELRKVFEQLDQQLSDPVAFTH